MSINGRLAYQLAFQVSPIILQNGLADSVTGGLLPLLTFTQALSSATSAFTGITSLNLSGFTSSLTNLSEYFAQFVPMPGSTLVNNQIGQYPFANQTVAANAIIAQPLNVSLKMICPANGSTGYITKTLTMLALKQALAQHNSLGGTYIVLTPSYIYNNCILTSLHDVSSGQTKQVQTEWQFDFVQPLVTTSEATNAYNNLANKMDNLYVIQSQTPSWSGAAATIGGVFANSFPT